MGPETLQALREAGFNRVSFGVQDFDPAVREAVHRVQSPESTLATIAAARRARFDSVNVDLMGTGGNVQFSQEASMTAPIGAVGLFGRKLLGTRWLLESDLRVLALGISRFDIRVLDFNVATRYALSPRFQIETGVGGSGVKIDVAPRTLPSGDPGVRSGVIKYSMMNVRAGLVFVP